MPLTTPQPWDIVRPALLYDSFHRWEELFVVSSDIGSDRSSSYAGSLERIKSDAVGSVPAKDLPVRAGYDKSSSSSTYAASSRSPPAAAEWLLSACAAHIESHVDTGIMSPEQLAKEVRDICAKEKNEDSLQIRLFDLIGENGFDVICEVIAKAKAIGSITDSELSPSKTSASKDKDTSGAKQSGGNFVVQTESEKASRAQMKKKEQRNQAKRDEPGGQGACEGSDAQTDWLRMAGFSEEYLNEERMLGLQSDRDFQEEGYAADNPWLQSLIAGGNRVVHDRVGLPEGTTRKFAPGIEEVFIPAPARPKQVPNDSLVQISALEDWAQLAFADTKRLNRIQSAVFDTAYYSAENMLVCAPTGAGKTNIAMLTLLQQIKMRMVDGRFDKSSLKAVYIAPMKALAQEVVTKFSERLKPLGLVVKEFTGDMQLTRQEIADSNLIVSTPEKWDVVTRKGGDGSLGTMVTLIIIDEIHLLADERGAVLETIVARTQRYVESSQKFIRLVGLSATLPNYRDVASFLRVNQSTGMFFFGPEYRPVPLDMTFVGVTEKAKPKRDEQMNRSAYEKMTEALKKGKQVMIFVHSRKDTSKTIEAVTDLSAKYNTLSLLENFDHPQYSMMKKRVDKSGGMELQKFFARGCGVHHAGMQRSDRTLTEQLFEMGLVKVLCCTATLAWGVNLPAHTVIIKGTELYDPERGGFVDLSILDVLQIFGRAGRPQYDNTGHAIMITPHKTLNKYLNLIGHQAPIESSLIKALPDHLNAEIVNGTINNINEARMWLSYTFLFIRMRQNPIAYGLKFEDLFDDPQLEVERTNLVTKAAEILDRCMMCRFDDRSGNLGVTDLGRVASHYYIKYSTIEAFNTMLTAHLTDSEALYVLCSSSEFDQLKVRPEEVQEIDALRKHVHIPIKGAVEDTAGKVSVLLQGYLSQRRVMSFTLQSDTNYVVQNAGRICRALFEISLKRGWCSMAKHFLDLSKCIDRCVGPEQTPLRQFGNEFPDQVIRQIETRKASLEILYDMNPAEIEQLCHSQKIGSKVLSYISKVPFLEVSATVQPITRGIIRMSLEVSPSFEWSDRFHFGAEAFWIWVEDSDNEYIYHSEMVVVNKKTMSERQNLEFTIPVREPLPPQYFIRVSSERWLGSDNLIPVSFQHLMLPEMKPVHTNLLDVHPIPVTALNNKQYESLYSAFSHFNPIQSNLFHTLYHSDNNILVGAPTGSGKTITSELTILRVLNKRRENIAKGLPPGVIVYVAPLKALARERLVDWRKRLGGCLKLSVVELSGDVTPDLAVLKGADVIITTPEKWDGITRGWKRRDYIQNVELMIIDEIHLLGEDRGPVLEMIVSRMRFISAQTRRNIRFVGLSTALANPRDLGDWLGIGDVGLYNFRPSVRPIPMTIYIQGFPGKHYCPRMATMNKPTYAAILEHSPTKPVLVFVSSRRQTRLTALDLISYCAADENPKSFLHFPEEEAMNIASTIRDSALRDTLVFGVGIHHAGLDDHDRKVVEELFVSGKIQVLVCTSTLAWGVNFPAHLVVVKGTEFFDGKQKRYVDFPVTDVLQMMGRAGRPQFDDSGVACILVHEPKKNFYRKFLHEPFPLESSLHLHLHNHLNAEIASGSVNSVMDCIELLSWTFFFRRLMMNPSYYGLKEFTNEAVSNFLNQMVLNVLKKLQEAKCINFDQESGILSSTDIGKICSAYYVDYMTVSFFKLEIEMMDDPDCSAENLCYILSLANEFSELPVRHNEELLNADLAAELPWSTDSAEMDSPHTKAFLLLQAHVYRKKLPISDYINDTKSMLDQVPRVLSALMDIAISLRRGIPVVNLMRVNAMVYQRLSTDADALLQLPGIQSTEHCSRVNGYLAKGSKGLSGLLNASMDTINAMSTVAGPLQTQFIDYVTSLPKFSIRHTVANSSSEPEGSADSASRKKLLVSLSINCTRGNASTKAYLPKYHRSKNLSWCLVVTSTDGAEVLAFQRIDIRDRTMTVPLTLNIANVASNFRVRLMCDCVFDLGCNVVLNV